MAGSSVSAHGQLKLCGVTVKFWRAAPHGELVDQLLVTSFDGDAGRFVRVAVFDPAENRTLPDHRGLVHHATHTAMEAFATHADPLAAVAATTAALCEPGRPNMANPLTTAVWADVIVKHSHLYVLRTGRCGDGDVIISGSKPKALLEVPMWEPVAGDRWLAWVAEHRPDIETLWAQRQAFVGERDQYLCPPLGQFPDPTPDTAGPVAVPLDGELWVATDGAELDANTKGEALGTWIDHVLTRPLGDLDYSHGDIAAVAISAS